MSHPRDPGETFLGVPLGTDPFALLGLPRQPVSDTEVLQALGSKMSTIAGHARGQTPEANEIRLALHAAAAQLLDPQLQELLLHASSQTESPVPPAGQAGRVSPLPQPTLSADRHETLIESQVHPLSHDVLLVVASNGGWNASAMRRLAMLAHARGIASHEIPDAITRVLANPLTRPSPLPTTAPAAAPSPVEDDNGSRVGSVASSYHSGVIKRASLGSRLAPWLIGSVTLILLVLIWVRLTALPKQKAITEDDTTVSATESRQQTRESAAQLQSQEPAPAELTPREGMRSITRLATNSQALGDTELDEFRTAYRVVSSHWTELGSDQIGAVHNALLELLYKNAANIDAAQAIVAEIGQPMRTFTANPEGLRAWVLSVATMSRLSMERNLPTSLDSAIIGRLTASLGQNALGNDQSFEAAVMLALNAAANKLTSQNASEGSWRIWLDQLGAVARPGGSVYDEAVLDSIERVMLEGDDPAQSRAVFQALETLAAALKIEQNSPVAERLVGWLANDRVTVSDLGVVMRELISRSHMEDVDESLIPSPGTGESERMAIRTKLEEVLLGKDAGTSEAIASWMSIADQQLDVSAPRRPAELVARAVVLSRLSAAARSTLWGDQKAAESTLANLTGDVDRLVASIDPNATDYLGGNSADEWALKYIDARQNIPIRQALLGDLTRSKRKLGPVAAELLVRDAFLGSPATVRAQAREVVRLYADSPAVLNAVLEHLPRLPKIESSSELIEAVTYTRLPSTKSPAWSTKARQACVDELLRRLAGTGEGQVVDTLAMLLKESYDARLGSKPSSTSGADAVSLADSASQLSAMWRRLAEQEGEEIPLMAALDDLDHRAIGRLLLAEGSLDRFAAHQVTAVEAMSILVLAENPSARSRVEAIRSELSASRRNAKNVLEQIYACEAAGVKLWKLRLERSVS